MSEQEIIRRGLILYYSVTANTERVAMVFKEVMERTGWQCDALKVNQRLDINDMPYRMDDYDLLCVGFPVYAQLPPRRIIDARLGVLMPDRLFRGNPGFSSVADGWNKKGVVFTTFGGATRGTPHAIPGLNLTAARMEDMKIKCVGMFACAGGKWLEEVINPIARATEGWDVEEATEAIGRYMDDPKHPEFASMTEEQQAMYKDAVSAEIEPPYVTQWHRDVENRPNDRDLKKAEIFMQEIIEDFYGSGVLPSQAKDVEAYPHSDYICIS